MGNVSMKRRSLIALATMCGLEAASDLCPVALAQGRKVLNTMITPEPSLLIPGINNIGPSLIVGSKMFEGLLKYSPKLEPLPSLAKSWTVSPDKLTYVFTLQSGVTWHDGQPFTADDVVFCVTKLHPEVNPRLRNTLANVSSCIARDPSTVEMTLKNPFGPFLLNFDATCLPILPKHLYEGTDYRNAPANQTPVGTGALKFAEWKRGDFIRLVKNDKYWQPGKPEIDELVYRVIADSNLRSVALESGQVQLAGASDIEMFDVPRFRDNPDFSVTSAGWELFAPLSWLEINNRVKPLDDRRVRRALSMAIDRKFILDRLFFGIGKAATGPLCTTTLYYDPAVAKLPPFDIAAANLLLDEAGLKRGTDGTRFSLRLMPLPYGALWTRLAEYVRQTFSLIGVRANLDSVDFATWGQRVSDWDYDMTINFPYQWGDATIGVERSFVTSNIQKIALSNTMGYSNPLVDAAFALARRSADPKERQAACTEVQRLLIEDMPVIWLMELAFPTITDKRVKNVITTATGVTSGFADVTM